MQKKERKKNYFIKMKEGVKKEKKKFNIFKNHILENGKHKPQF